jgi:hypothetical protein
MSTKKREPRVALDTNGNVRESGSPDATEANVSRGAKGRKMKAVTLEIPSGLPPLYRPSPIKGELVGEGRENYLVKDPLEHHKNSAEASMESDEEGGDDRVIPSRATEGNRGCQCLYCRGATHLLKQASVTSMPEFVVVGQKSDVNRYLRPRVWPELLAELRSLRE